MRPRGSRISSKESLHIASSPTKVFCSYHTSRQGALSKRDGVLERARLPASAPAASQTEVLLFQMVHASWWYYFSKFTEFFDTVSGSGGAAAVVGNRDSKKWRDSLITSSLMIPIGRPRSGLTRRMWFLPGCAYLFNSAPTLEFRPSR